MKKKNIKKNSQHKKYKDNFVPERPGVLIELGHQLILRFPAIIHA